MHDDIGNMSIQQGRAVEDENGRLCRKRRPAHFGTFYRDPCQEITENDQNACSTNRSDKLVALLWLSDATGKLFSWFFGANMFAGMSSQILGKKFDILRNNI